tara:strand:- start:1145 stop:1300 length:156 start_codon:yes stop_codon:yes gene_type:complete
MEQYTKYLKDKKVIFGLIVVALILFNAIKGCGSCGEEKTSCETTTCQHGGV